MALVRILVDGYSLLHSWPALTAGQPPYSEGARDELIHRLTQYRDVIGTPITIIFDGAQVPSSASSHHSTPELEVLYSRSGRTADDVIERLAHRLKPFGEALVVTNDFMERETVLASGGLVSNCDNFIMDVEAALGHLHRARARHNRGEARAFLRPRK